MSLFFSSDGRSFHTDGVDERKLRWPKRTVHERQTAMSPWSADRSRARFQRYELAQGHHQKYPGAWPRTQSNEAQSPFYRPGRLNMQDLTMTNQKWGLALHCGPTMSDPAFCNDPICHPRARWSWLMQHYRPWTEWHRRKSRNTEKTTNLVLQKAPKKLVHSTADTVEFTQWQNYVTVCNGNSIVQLLEFHVIKAQCWALALEPWPWLWPWFWPSSPAISAILWYVTFFSDYL